MALDMFIDIAGIPGESKDSKYLNKIDVLNWHWGMAQSGTFHTGGGGGAGKANVQDLTFTKYLDSASAPLMLSSLNGKHLDTAKLIVRKAGEGAKNYIEITMTQVMVTSVTGGNSSGDDRLTETVQLNFAYVEFLYYKQTETGNASVDTRFAFDIAGNKVA